MAQYSVGTLPGTSRRARESLHKRWTNHVDESSPAWTVVAENKAAVVAMGSSSVVVLISGLTGSEFTTPLAGVRPVQRDPQHVDLVDSVGYPTRITFEHPRDASAFVKLAGERAGERMDAVRTRRRALDEILLVTSDSVPGWEIVTVHGDVFGVVVRARNIFSNMAASLRTVAGGEVGGYTRLMTDTRNDARERLAVAAVDCGANAVVAMRYSTSEVAELMSEVVAYGTAVTIRRPSHGPPPGSEQRDGQEPEVEHPRPGPDRAAEASRARVGQRSRSSLAGREPRPRR